MKLKALVLDERLDEYTGKRGLVRQTVLVMLDMEPEGRLDNTFDYLPSEEEKERLGSNLRDKQVEVVVTSLFPGFGGRLRAKGRILSAPGI